MIMYPGYPVSIENGNCVPLGTSLKVYL